MVAPEAVKAGSNGHDPALAVCSLADLPPAVHQYIHVLESRVQHLEAEQERFSEAMKKAGQFIFNSPQGKMISMAFPKEMQEGLKKFFDANS